MRLGFTAGASQTDYGYTGEYTANDLVYLRARHYSPTMGRFFTRDPFAGNVAYPASLNPYTYAYNNPTLYTDPRGDYVEPATFLLFYLPLLLALTAGGADLYYQLDRNNGNWECVDWGEVAMYAGGAAVAGLLVGVSVYAITASRTGSSILPR